MAIQPEVTSDQHMDKIIQAAQKAHKDTWKLTGVASTGTKKAIVITKAWQDSALDPKKPWIQAEYSVAPSVKQRFDMVDLKRGIAYELKVSPNNAHMEVYRDLFKVLVHNQYSEKPLTKFIFITPTVSADRLRQKPFWNEVVKLAAGYGVVASIESIQITFDEDSRLVLSKSRHSGARCSRYFYVAGNSIDLPARLRPLLEYLEAHRQGGEF